jgi:deazaflavin-dependent oxidoreductase (nitroreductase family)
LRAQGIEPLSELIEPDMSVKVVPNGTRGRNFPAVNAFFRAALGLNAAVYRLLHGRGMGKMGLLTTVGAKTGQRRSLPLAVFEAGPEMWWVVASKGGAAEHPAWYRNLAKNPDQVELEIRGRRQKVTPESLHGRERAAAWKSIVERSPNFGDYEKSTDREIPVIQLTPSA